MTTVDLSDSAEPAPPRRWREWAIWTTLGVVYGVILSAQVPLALPAALLSALQYFYSLALIMIPVRRLSARLLHAALPAWRMLLAEIAIGAVAIAVWQAVNVGFHRLEVGPHFWASVYADTWLFQLLSAAVIYIATVGINLAALAVARDRARERAQHHLEVAARDAELAALKAQFQPHFVLNALNSLLALIDRNPALARTMVVRLADLMKSVFERIDLDLVPLERELDLIRAYLDIERIRLGTRLSVSFDVDDQARGVLVPPFLLQPVVENAVKHGISPFAEAGSVDVSASVRERSLVVRVADSGRGTLDAPASSGTGRGLQITRRRLDGVYGGQGYRLELTPTPAGTVVEIELPAERRGVA